MTAIIDYGAGNTKSVMNLLDRIQQEYILSDQPEIINSAARIILPGVGHAAPAMGALQQRGLINILRQYQKPVLGICLGFQLLFDYSEEGNVPCLALIHGSIRRFPANAGEKVPHMGWNMANLDLGCPLFKNLEPSTFFYFVHSYFANVNRFTVAGTTHIVPFSAAVMSKNIYGVQFHPEKSGMAGEQLIRNFVDLV